MQSDKYVRRRKELMLNLAIARDLCAPRGSVDTELPGAMHASATSTNAFVPTCVHSVSTICRKGRATAHGAGKMHAHHTVITCKVHPAMRAKVWRNVTMDTYDFVGTRAT